MLILVVACSSGLSQNTRKSRGDDSSGLTKTVPPPVLPGGDRTWSLSPLIPDIAKSHRGRPNVGMCADRSKISDLETLVGVEGVSVTVTVELI